MEIIYDNIPANSAPDVDYALQYPDTKVVFSADHWGATQFKIDVFSVGDKYRKVREAFISDSAGLNGFWCIPCPTFGEVYRFSIEVADALTTKLFVQILKGEPIAQ